jgi:Toprim-like
VTEGNRRYLQVSGGSNGLYLVQSLLFKRPAVVLTEGELDALSIAQACGDLVAVVATGTTKGSHTPRWISLLAQQERVLVAFDAERDKGDAGAQWWIERLDNAQRLRPLWNDANQMLQDGVNLREWIRAALAKTAAPVVTSPGESHKETMQAQPASLTQHVYTSDLSSFVNPQTRCPFVHVVVDRKGFIKGVPCQSRRNRCISKLRERSTATIRRYKATSNLMGKLRGDNSLTE